MILIITTKDLAPLDETALEIWRKELRHRKAKTLLDLYLFSQDFFGWVCTKDYVGCTCNDCTAQEVCLRCKLTLKEVKHELTRRFPK